ncbi:hypothetical protein NKF26_23400 [Haladaptatus sp. AB618]|uniref:hypothetical protein n=1 Tax=Haladaptatus sp. AB618 TaxID=2934173 RepID=UPI00209C245D|nr:hypothetical protein [Haladaptatus sp. AB618]MCO8256772.1 hypothetical protein [Haladaptatus sp. AB618]
MIDELSSDEILSTEAEDVAEYAVNQHEIDPLNLEIDNPKVTIDDWGSDEEPTLRYRYTGNERILHFQPNPHTRSEFRTEVNEDENHVDVYFPRKRDGYSNKQLKKQHEKISEFVEEHYQRVQSNINEHYDEIREHAKRLHEEQQKKVQEQQQQYSDVGFDVTRRRDVNKTLKIDEPKRRSEITIDDISKERPDPGISDDTYHEIIEAVDAVGHGFEKSPETYSDFEEEDYRNVMLTFLEMNFEGSATGETFNRMGKTDILLRHDGDNIFIAECGMWSGPQTLSGSDDEGGKISQLIERYLTWRDSKTAVILFVERESFSNILEKIPDAIEAHPLCAGEKEKKAENWWQYSFDRPDDQENPVDIATLAFDVSTDQ